MRVITNNYKPEYPKQIICNNPKCKSVLEYYEGDVEEAKQKVHDQRQGDYIIIIKYIVCPCCNLKTAIE